MNNINKKSAYTSIFIMMLLTVLMVQVISIFSFVSNTSVVKQNNNYFLSRENRILDLKYGIVNDLTNQVSTLTDGYQLKLFVKDMGSKVNVFESTNNCEIQITSLSNTVYQMTVLSKLNSTSSNKDLQFSFYIEYYKKPDNTFAVRLRGVI